VSILRYGTPVIVVRVVVVAPMARRCTPLILLTLLLCRFHQGSLHISERDSWWKRKNEVCKVA
jgi:hypothetical protein